ncbi:hypothetical protein A2U01_0045760, partial [Trifolium medium]|nr:hypothetical protein [Trifolium medium]
GSMGEIVVHGGHPTVGVPNNVYVEDIGGFFDTWSGQDFLDYGFIPAPIFCARQLGQDVCSLVMSARDMLYFRGIELAPTSSANRSPARKVSYLAWLFDVGNDKASETL